MKVPHRGLIYSAVGACSLVSLPLFAHPASRPGTAENPLVVLDVLIPMLIAAAWYACGVIRLWRRSGPGRGLRPFHVALFVLGWLSLFGALLSRLDELGAELFSAHMVQHEVLMLISAPLLVLSQPMPAFLWALPHGARIRLSQTTRATWIATTWHVLTRPLVAWTLHAVALWGWHVPAFFQSTLVDRTIHNFQHISFFVTALLFWSSLFGTRSREANGAAVLYLFTTMVHSSILGALLTFASRPWYPAYLETAPLWGFTALEDQQLGGLIMWVPASLVYVAVGLSLLARWISTPTGRLKTGTG